MIAKAGMLAILFLNQKSYFPALCLGTQTADVGRPHLEDKELMQDLSILRVSVLDLDNSVRFSRDTKEKTEETVFNIASPKGDLTEIIPVLRAIKQC